MKQAIVLTVLALTLFYSSISIAEDTALTLTAAASSSLSSYYGHDKTVDGNESTYWIGGFYKSPWWITFDTGSANYIAKINMKWQDQHYTPTDCDIQVSFNGVAWENVYSGVTGVCSAQGDIKDINKAARYLRLYVRSTKYDFLTLKEVKIYGRKTANRLMRFQGSLNDKDGMPLEGSFTLTFRIYDTETGGTALWSETQSDINIEEGLLNTELGSITPLNALAFDKQYWLSIEADSDSEMTPRFKLTGAPYSFTLQ